MRHKTLISILMFIFTFCGVNCLAQGKVSRPVQQRPQTNNLQKQAQEVAVSEPDGYINGHGYVDLGLPSGTKWATCNVGAKYPYEYGKYFAWGEINPRNSYTEENSNYDIDGNTLRSRGIIDSAGVLNENYDAAHINMGATWRIPQNEIFEELLKECKWEWVTYKETKGYIVTGSNGKTIFLPAAGEIYETNSGPNLDSIGKKCYYWASSYLPFSDNSGESARYFSGEYKHLSAGYIGIEYYGMTVRAISILCELIQ